MKFYPSEKGNEANKKRGCFPFLIIGILYVHSAFAQCSNIDQSQLIYNGGMSARNLPGYSEWQSFTSGTTGTLCQIDMGFFNFMSGTGTFNIYSGTGTGGTLLQTQPVTVAGTGNFFHTFLTSVPVTSGAIYTFHFIPIQGGGLPDPYGVQVQSPGSYSGGELNIVDPSGTYPTGFDMVFKTYVSSSTGIATADTPSLTLNAFPNPFSQETTLEFSGNLKEATLIIFDNLGREVLVYKNINGSQIVISKDELKEGIYFVKLMDDEKLITIIKLVLTTY